MADARCTMPPILPIASSSGVMRPFNHERVFGVNDFLNTHVFSKVETIETVMKMSFAERLVHARQHAGFRTQRELAKAAGFKGQSTIGNMEAGRNQGARHIMRLAAACGVSAHWLETGDGDMLAPAVDELHSDQIQLAGIWRRLDSMGKMKLMGFALGLDSIQGSSNTQVTTRPTTRTLPKAERGTDSAK